MQTDIITPQELFSPERRMEAPLFQRPYVWDEENQWAPLWEDLRAVAEAGLAGEHAPEHFLGAVVVQTRETGLTELPARTIIDGQQRLTTLQVVLGSLADVLESSGLDLLAGRARRLTVNDVEEDAPASERFKVWPTNRDQEAYTAVMDAAGPEDVPATLRSSLLAQAHDYFTAHVTEWVEAGPQPAAERASVLLDAVTRGLRMVVISLTAEDDGQAIFETLNARGTPLTAMDLVKNFLLQGLDPHSARTQELYERYWRRFETAYWQEEIGVGRVRQQRSTAFLSWWLAARTAQAVPGRSAFSAFKRYTLGPGGGTSTVLESLSVAAGRYEELDRASHVTDGVLRPP